MSSYVDPNAKKVHMTLINDDATTLEARLDKCQLGIDNSNLGLAYKDAGGGYHTLTQAQQGAAGLSGKSGYSGYSGRSGYSGTSGYSGFSADSGHSGQSGYSGFSGSGYSGFSGSGYSGFSGSGYSGFSSDSGYSGYSSDSGYSGYSSDSGYSGYSGTGDRYTTSSTTALDLDDGVGIKNLTVEQGLALSPGQVLNIVFDASNYMSGGITGYTAGTGALIVNAVTVVGSGSHSLWAISLGGVPGAVGQSGDSGYSGYVGETGATGLQGTTGTIGESGQSGFSGYVGSAGAAGATGATGATGASGTSGRSGYSGKAAGVVRVTTLITGTTASPNCDTTDLFTITSLGSDIVIGNPSGTPGNGQAMIFRIVSNNSGWAISWGSKFANGGAIIPATTTALKLITVGFMYSNDSNQDKWWSTAYSIQP